ncbi:type VI secretion system-associated protein TagO [Zwartia vadi]|uniref:type VI secretion system-associated protein TagO n=1 Tax=Zwartia vadi TaxID=3058168 RepID=UPI0025B5CB88|nr:type VI secretion system-associated protein TagO [Zwartia vadi]MDN3986769.1 type VI secretion system-associated protein TagO [Zwartia vadi]
MKSFLVALSIGLLTTTTAAHAQTLDKEIARCAATAGNLDRLECYDQLARRNNLLGPQSNLVPTAGVGKWAISDKTNPIDDTRTVVLVLEATSGSARSGQEVRLVLRCQSKKTEAYINWHDFLGTDSAEVTYRIGNAKAIKSTWSLSTDNKATFFPGDPVAFMKALIEQNTFVAQVTPYMESPLTSSFDTTGLVNAIKPLRETCGW